MPNDKKDKLLNEFMVLLNDEDKLMFRQVAGFLLELGYVPQKQKVQGNVLAFKLNKTNKIIAKIGIRNGSNQRAFFSIKFFACKIVPQKYINSLQHEIDSRNGQYCGPIRSSNEKNRCGFCGTCTGGGLGYYFAYPDGKEVLRCGAYPITINDLTPNDIDEMKSLLLEQHRYFLSLA